MLIFLSQHRELKEFQNTVIKEFEKRHKEKLQRLKSIKKIKLKFCNKVLDFKVFLWFLYMDKSYPLGLIRI